MEDFRPLSRRNVPDPRFDEVQEGVPPYLMGPLLDWFEGFVWHDSGMGEVWVDKDFVRTVQLRLRLAPPLTWTHAENAAGELRARLERDPELALDAVDVALRELTPGYGDGAVSELNEILATGGSVWEAVSDDEGRLAWYLRRRVVGAVRDMIETLGGSAARAHDHLTSALRKISVRDPDPSGAYRDAVKAVESVAKPLVIPQDELATLGKIIGAIRAAPQKWTYPLGGPEGMLDMLTRIWTGQHDRHGTDDPDAPLDVSLDEAVAAVHLAVAVSASFASGVFGVRAPG